MTTIHDRCDVLRTAGGAVDIEFYEAKARRARAEVFQDVIARTRVLDRAFARAGIRRPGP